MEIDHLIGSLTLHEERGLKRTKIVASNSNE